MMGDCDGQTVVNKGKKWRRTDMIVSLDVPLLHLHTQGWSDNGWFLRCS